MAGFKRGSRDGFLSGYRGLSVRCVAVAVCGAGEGGDEGYNVGAAGGEGGEE